MDLLMALPHFRELRSETRAEQRAGLLTAVQVPRRRRYVLAAAVVLAVFAAAPTLAFQRELVDFWSAEPAPERIQLDFDHLKKVNVHHRAKGLRTWPEPVGTAREVLTVRVDGETRPLWVVPAEGGGFCFRFHFHGSCGGAPGDGAAGMKLGVGGLANHGGGLQLLVGTVMAPEIEEVVLLYEDGERMKLPYVWVSPPIDAGFFAFGVPEDRRVVGRLTAVVVGLDPDGNEVAAFCLNRSPEALARSAVLREHCERPR
jgi:hypothetical protein